MLDALRWFLVAEAIGLAAFPLAYAAFPFLSDRGWGVTKPLGLLVTGFAIWGLSYLGILDNAAWAWWLAAAVMFATGLPFLLKRWRELRQFFRTRWKAILVAELLFILFFAAFAVMRANDPNISGTEKPMEVQLLNAATVARAAPPEDPWFSGEPVAYYYGGYWDLAGVGKMSAVPTAKGFNLSIALIAAMAATAIFSLVYNMVRRDGGAQSPALLAGVGAAVILLILSSLAGWWELAAHLGLGTDGFYEWLAIDGLARSENISSWRPDQFWWWFRASRVINTFDADGAGLDFTIQEFPIFSLLLGDLHPHVISIPFVLTGLAAAYNLLLSRARWGFSWLARYPLSAAVLALIIGSSGFINQADIILITALFLGVTALKAYGDSRGRARSIFIRGLPATILVVGAGVALFIPFYFGTLGGQVQFPPIAPAKFGTRPVQFLTVWGLMLLLIAPFLLNVVAPVVRPYILPGRGTSDPGPSSFRNRRQPPRMSEWLTPALMVAVPYLTWFVTHVVFNDRAEGVDIITRLGTVFPLSIAFMALFFVAVRRAASGARGPTQFGLLIAALAIYLLFGAELFFVNDLFGSRMNTVFKFYYQSWILLSVVAGYSLYYWTRIHPSLGRKSIMVSRTAAVLAVVLLAGPLWYPVAAATTKAAEYTGPVTIDGWAHLDRWAEADAEAIKWLTREAAPGSHIVEAVGGGYTEHARLSAATGLPTILGWPGHERQWRGPIDEIGRRKDDVQTLYETTDTDEAVRLLELYEIDYVVIGARELAAYPALSQDKFDILGARVFEQNGMTIYHILGQQD